MIVELVTLEVWYSEWELGEFGIVRVRYSG